MRNIAFCKIYEVNMTNRIIVLVPILIIILLFQLAQAAPHFDLEMTGPEYLKLIEARKTTVMQINDEPSIDPKESEKLEKYLEFGKRNLMWIDAINSKRTGTQKLSISSAATAQGYPISNPRMLNFKSIETEWSNLSQLLPPELKKVIFDNAPISATAPLSDREMIEWLIQVDRAYRDAARYTLLAPYKETMAQGRSDDVRGYVQIRDNANINEQLRQWNSLDERTKNSLKKSLLMICFNTVRSDSYCSDFFASNEKSNTLVSFKDTFIQRAKAQYDGFFEIPVMRNDYTWLNENTLQLPFANPKNDQIMNFLKVNIEDEYKWKNWKLNLKFVDTNSKNTTHVVFVPGVTPRVNGLGGSEITMDSNSLISEYDIQWTIRHEYGHVLGLRDCYIEFYDEELESFISYQLDVTNFMCSRRGKFKQLHYDKLMKVYKK